MSALEVTKSQCPYCGETIELVLDPSVAHQSYVEDCFVCCRPIQVTVSFETAEPIVQLSTEDY